jgi:DNA polymerase I-like protein with 3'-5' exonuclease and polymerase domains
MMKLVLDVENTVNDRGGKMHLDPFEPSNKLVQVGFKNVDIPTERFMLTFDHNEYKDIRGTNSKLVQAALDATSLLIMHNAQHDLMWLWASGFTYEGAIWDTMLAEYVLLRGQKEPLSLGACAERRQLAFQKDNTLKTYLKNGFNVDEMPLDELTYYLGCDLDTTGALYEDQVKDYADPSSTGMITVRDTTFNVCKTLTRMYMKGIKVDRDALNSVRKLFEEELAGIEDRLSTQVKELMGDTPINLNSPEQMSQVVFSRKLNNKKEWVGLFDFANTPKEFKATIAANTETLTKTSAFTCPTCSGTGKTFKTKKDGSLFAKGNKCVDCDARGYQLKKTNVMAGLGFTPPSKTWITANGFGTGKDNLDVLISTAKDRGNDNAIGFLTDLKRLSAVSSYLSSFVEGIDVFTKADADILHVSLTQHITSTGRFSGRNPNMQNMPRGGTFPVKRVFISRWEGGKILEADFAQLEFRVAAFLSQDVLAMQEIATGFDVHSYTAKVITDAGQVTTRQGAKEHTFAPLFGATGYGRSKAEEAYYIHFTEKYEGIAAWHKSLADEAIRFQKITTPSGRQYAFPDVARRKNGGVTHFTMIKNYPVQGFATGDVVPVVLMEMERRLMPLHSCLVNTVHDSTVVDVHPDEVDQVIDMIKEMNEGLNLLIKDAYGIDVNVPLLLEAKIGNNWLDVKDVA